MAPPPGRLGRGVKLPVHVRLCPEAIAAVDACAAELSQQRDGAAFRRAEALRMAALTQGAAGAACQWPDIPRHSARLRRHGS